MDIVQKVNANYFIPEPSSTIAQLKHNLEQWLNPKIYNVTNVSIEFNDGTKIDPAVFKTDVYDQVNFDLYKDKLNNATITITVKQITPYDVTNFRREFIENIKKGRVKPLTSGKFGKIYIFQNLLVKEIPLANTDIELKIQHVAAALEIAPKVYDGWLENSTLYIVMEKINGNPFQHREDILLNIDFQQRIFNILSTISSEGIIHGDLHPSNFMEENTTKRLYLIDYGSSEIKTNVTPGLIMIENLENLHEKWWLLFVQSRHVNVKWENTMFYEELVNLYKIHRPFSSMGPVPQQQYELKVKTQNGKLVGKPVNPTLFREYAKQYLIDFNVPWKVDESTYDNIPYVDLTGQEISEGTELYSTEIYDERENPWDFRLGPEYNVNEKGIGRVYLQVYIPKIGNSDMTIFEQFVGITIP